MLCDVTKIHTGYGVMPRVTHTTDDEDWGKEGSSKKIHVARSISQKGGFASMDRIIKRVENEYWIIQVDEFQSWMLGFYKFTGKWKTSKIGERKILVEYSYNLHSKNPIFYLFNWIFVKIFWRQYMKRVLENIRNLAYGLEPYRYD